jgi:galactose-1-phosphate uridylyltransferase
MNFQYVLKRRQSIYDGKFPISGFVMCDDKQDFSNLSGALAQTLAKIVSTRSSSFNLVIVCHFSCLKVSYFQVHFKFIIHDENGDNSR